MDRIFLRLILLLATLFLCLNSFSSFCVVLFYAIWCPLYVSYLHWNFRSNKYKNDICCLFPSIFTSITPKDPQEWLCIGLRINILVSSKYLLLGSICTKWETCRFVRYWHFTWNQIHNQSKYYTPRARNKLEWKILINTKRIHLETLDNVNQMTKEILEHEVVVSKLYALFFHTRFVVVDVVSLVKSRCMIDSRL